MRLTGGEVDTLLKSGPFTENNCKSSVLQFSNIMCGDHPYITQKNCVNANNQHWKRLISADSPKPWDLSLGRWTASLQSPVKNAGWSWLVCKSGYPEIHPNPAIVIISVPLKTPGIQWYHFWTKRRVQERSPWIFRRSSVLTFGRPSKCVGFEKRLLRTWAPPWPSAFSATEIHSSPWCPKVSRGALRCRTHPMEFICSAVTCSSTCNSLQLTQDMQSLENHWVGRASHSGQWVVITS